MAVFPIPAQLAHGRRDAGRARHYRQPRECAAMGAQVRPGICQPDPAASACGWRQMMEWMPLLTASRCAKVVMFSHPTNGEASMEKVSIIGLDLAKRSFQAHGSRADGGVGFRKKLSREKVLGFFAEQPRCVVAMEACGKIRARKRNRCHRAQGSSK